jgi:hypothetical protein
MLFDLRSRRRRRVVKTVYLFLAVLIGLGLVGFGIGTGGNFGGILNAAGNGGGGAASGDALYLNTLKKAEKHAAAHASDPAAWVAVGTAAVNVSQLPDYFVQGTGYTKSGYAVLKTLKKAWNNYLALAPKKLNGNLASSVANAFGTPPNGIGDYKTAESAQEIAVQTDPSYTEYEYLAYYAYLAHEKSRGDLAGARAIALAPKSSKKQVTQALVTFQQQAGLIGSTGSSGSTSSTGSTGSTG